MSLAKDIDSHREKQPCVVHQVEEADHVGQEEGQKV